MHWQNTHTKISVFCKFNRYECSTCFKHTCLELAICLACGNTLKPRLLHKELLTFFIQSSVKLSPVGRTLNPLLLLKKDGTRMNKLLSPQLDRTQILSPRHSHTHENTKMRNISSTSS